MERTIKVTGNGKAKAEADLVRLTFELNAIDREYDRAFHKMEAQQDDFQSIMKKLGFDRDCVKSTDFSVNEQYDHYEGKKIFREYAISHSMQISFDFVSARLAEILSAVKNSKSKPSIDIRFMTKDEEGLKKRVLADAVKNARERAEIITAAAGCQLEEILAIDQSWQEVRVESDFRCYGLDKAMPMGAIDINPEDVGAEDTVTVIWRIA